MDSLADKSGERFIPISVARLQQRLAQYLGHEDSGRWERLAVLVERELVLSYHFTAKTAAKVSTCARTKPKGGGGGVVEVDLGPLLFSSERKYRG